MKDEHITKLRELVARKQKKHPRQEESAIDDKELNDLKILVETLKSELGEAEDDKKSLEKAIDEAEEHAKRQEKTLKAQERALAKAEKQKSGSKNYQNEIKQLENEKLNIMAKLSHMTKETNAMQERIRELELENQHLVNESSKVPDTFYSSRDIVTKHAVEESKTPMMDLPHEYRQQPPAQPTRQRPNNSMNEDTTMVHVTGEQDEQEKQQHNNAGHMTNEASAEYAGVETGTTTTKGSTKNSPRKPRQKKQQRNSSEVTEKKRTPRRKQQPASSPEPTFPSGADQSPVLEYLGNDFEPVLQLPNVDNNVDAPPVPEKMKTIDDLQDNHQYNVAATSQPDTVNTQQFDRLNTQQTSHQGDTQSNIAATSQPDTVDTQQSEAMSTQQSEDHQSKPRRQTRKRRRLVDPKKRMAEDYEGDLSPLAKVNRIIQQSGDE
ncbi:hypothetical protein K492DRAFT_82191 [Lichtheimia hyalospora FSU 10163]|nr:hypothetical protein K492DRAFT_82191 [Lichtheimia hyalospora FSU 10163]